MDNTLFTIQDYGYIRINLKSIMDSKNLTRNTVARAINTRFEVVDKWYNGHVEKLDTDILARICFVLECTPADIIEYIRKKLDCHHIALRSASASSNVIMNSFCLYSVK